MKISASFYIALFLASVMVYLQLSCNEPAEPEYKVTFKINHTVDEWPLLFDTIRYINAVGNEYSIMTLRYFISDITLQKPGEDALVFNEDHYVDATDKSTLLISPKMKVPTGTYSGVSFIFGLDTLKNQSGKFTNPPKSKMEWPAGMGGGYHYMKIEGKFHSSGTIKSFQAHSGELMGKPYFININLPESSFTIDKQDVTIEIILDINNWWVNPNMLDLNNITSIMGDTAVQQQLKENGADVFSVGLIQ